MPSLCDDDEHIISHVKIYERLITSFGSLLHANSNTHKVTCEDIVLIHVCSLEAYFILIHNCYMPKLILILNLTQV